MEPPKEIRFGEFVRQVGTKYNRVSYNKISAKPKKDSAGKPLPINQDRLKLTGLEVYRVLAPYTGVRFMEQFKAVVPLALYLVLFKFLFSGKASKTHSLSAEA